MKELIAERLSTGTLSGRDPSRSMLECCVRRAGACQRRSKRCRRVPRGGGWPHRRWGSLDV